MKKRNLLIYLLLSVFQTLAINKEQPVTPPSPVFPIPTDRQLAWQEMEQYAFIHFTTNTFTGKEWGYGDESPEVFNPSEIDVNQWIKSVKEAGLKAIILTCKHHDGFCLWPSQFTEHSVKNSKWKNGQGDIVKEVAEACHKNGLKFGVYLSPWDRNRSDYGSPSYVEYYRNQLRELFTNYGPVFEMWFDGANGGDGFYGGAKEKRKISGSTYYDWPTTLEMVRKIEPGIVFFSDAGPDIRWCGNEGGHIGETNWSAINSDTLFAGKSGIEKILNSGEENGKNWIPAEVDVSIRPGWFYHAEEDNKVKIPEKLFESYLSSVGRGANLILNIPPDRRGLFHKNDVKALRGWKQMIDDAFKNNLALNSVVKADSYRGNSKLYAAANVTDGNKETYWATNDNVTTGKLVIDLGSKKTVKYITIQEYIKLGQRVKSFVVYVWKNSNWVEVTKGSTIGYKRILKIEPTVTGKVKIEITASKASPLISNFEVY
ncbi:MAG: alpha-L-fucosidase [Bacteroidia bacterium]|nr:alpha-L-fucosidase [Bacteroidia bacterium]